MSVSKVSFGGNDLINLENDTVTALDMLSGKTAHNSSGAIITGTIQSLAASTITPGTANQTIAAGKYLSGAQTISGDANLVAGNIKSGVSIFGVTGTCGGMQSFEFTATANTQVTVNTGLSTINGFYLCSSYVTGQAGMFSFCGSPAYYSYAFLALDGTWTFMSATSSHSQCLSISNGTFTIGLNGHYMQPGTHTLYVW